MEESKGQEEGETNNSYEHAISIHTMIGFPHINIFKTHGYI